MSVPREQYREHRRRRFRRRGRRAYIRSVYFLPSLATLGNAVCGFGSIYVSALGSGAVTGDDPLTQFFARHHFVVAAYLIFAAMIFDALDGRLARFARHTTDFGGQLDSLADVVSFGAAPAFLALQLFKADGPAVPTEVSRAVWAIGALYLSCAAMRLARFNVSNQHGEQHHFSFLGLPSPGSAGTVAGYVLLQRTLAFAADTPPSGTGLAVDTTFYTFAAAALLYALPAVLLLSGLLMVSNFRYPHLVNRYLRGKRSLARLLFVLTILLALVVAHELTVAVGTLVYALTGPLSWAMARTRRVPTAAQPTLTGPKE